MSRGFNLVGKVFGRLTVVKYLHTAPNGKVWKLKCECGQTTNKHTGALTTGNTRSCGCLKKEMVAAKNFKHGFAPRDSESTAIYHAYWNARRRCTNPKDRAWKYYGGRGIEFRFHSLQEFFSTVGKKPSSRHVLDRIKNDGHYEPGNMRWATPKQSSENQRRRKRNGQVAR